MFRQRKMPLHGRRPRGGQTCQLAQEGCHAFVEQVSDGRRQPREDQTNGKPVLNEVLDIGGQWGQLSPIGGMDLVNGNKPAGAVSVQKTERLLTNIPPGHLTCRRQLGGDAETGSGDGSDAACRRAVTEFVRALGHGFTEPGHAPVAVSAMTAHPRSRATSWTSPGMTVFPMPRASVMMVNSPGAPDPNRKPWLDSSSNPARPII
ncbi:hypothetical protein [Arthrobacter sp. STN4]|uniref:hypothetical protein n=1 Tax=Arthrobacter sp. STN4 TaxID=2923276 RepID=UPI00211A17AB|nr:hypothetical protein [Arthrobacter sp. STN4]MCQ9165097.1 hypothetical protein [Arthrobacter sp. STN4]